ncbi:MAG: GAF domain-containing protein [Anaerolineae bacterium]|nr:GAF domain-containing protein [Anaerolineae bacterium]
MTTEARRRTLTGEDATDVVKITHEQVAGRSTEWVGSVAATAGLIVSTLVVLYSALLAFNWYNHPFLGVLVSHDLVISGTVSVTNQPWAGFNANLKTFDRILGIAYDDAGVKQEVNFEGQPNPGVMLNDILATRRPAQLITVKVFRAGQFRVPNPACSMFTSEGATCAYSYRLSQFPFTDFATQFGVGFIVEIIMLAIGWWMWIRRREQPFARLIIGFCAAGAVGLISRFEGLSTFQLAPFWLVGACAVGVIFIQIGLEFPYPLQSIHQRSWLRWLLIISPIALFAISVILYFVNGSDAFYDAPQIAGIVSAVMGAFVVITTMVVRYRRSTSPVLREKSALVILGLMLAVAPTFVWLIMVVIERVTGTTGITFSSVYFLPLFLSVPISVAYAQGPNPVSSEKIIGTGITYGVMGALLIISFVLVTTAVYILTAGLLKAENPIVIALTLFVIALLFTPMRLRIERAIDAAFFRQRRQYEQRLEALSRKIASSVELHEVSKTVVEELQDALAPQYMYVFLRSYPSNDYEAVPDVVTGKPVTDLRFRADSDLVALFNGETSILRLDVSETPPIRSAAERARLTILNTPVIVRLRSARRLNGFVALGARQNRTDYGFEETRYLEAVATQAAAAYERAQIILEAQRNERELKVLSQVSAALNIVMDFDTLLEFIYAQVDKVIPTKNFYIVLRDQQTDELSFTFYQEDNDRIEEREGNRWKLGRDLYSEVIRTQQPFETDNFVQETQRRDPRSRIDNPALRAWMGVPLNAGEGINLGCLALATTDPTVTYSGDQMRIFWDIASLAATALYKTRLLNSAQERERQMKALNDISSRLATAFEDVDQLLGIITESAVEILNCQAGSLLLRADNDQELVFALGVGGTGSELMGKRIPLTSGIAGTVATTGRPVIVNDTQRDNRWFGEIDTQRGQAFTTNAILAVPLTARGVVIGVLEVINKKDGHNFNDQDLELLNTFASQAAVAIDNARLYRSTDEQLAIRVQQLDSMQKIDQELNRTLDLQRVIDLTVENALRESNATVGALVLSYPETSQFVVAGSRNYPPDIMQPSMTLDLTEGTLGRVYQTGHAWTVQGDSMLPALALLPDAQSQLAVPLITGQTISAVLLLESLEPNAFSPTSLAQIQALAEHANTAITNAQLYTQLDEANQSRTKFVGFVAHELKNPMASIKGYAEVLLGGLTGQLNDQQQNFIAVIRKNVVRMQQLVDDLRDLVAQESGKLTLRFAPVSFNNVILESLRPQQRAIDEKEQTVVLNVVENLPPVWGDELRLIQIMTNFISNAHKYTPTEGTITITAEVRQNIWDLQKIGDVMYCAISDTGIGMDDTDLAKLFTAYWRSDNPRAREQPGTGLGMTLTRGLVESHGGRLWVESRLNVGTTFHFFIPLASSVEVSNA